jgi:hypothetical protein
MPSSARNGWRTSDGACSRRERTRNGSARTCRTAPANATFCSASPEPAAAPPQPGPCPPRSGRRQGPAPARPRSRRLPDHQHEPDEAARLVGAALDLAHGALVRPILDRARAVRADMAGWTPSAALIHLDARLAEAG